VSSSKNITAATTLGELREQLQLFNIIALRIVPSLDGDSDDLLDASLHHATGLYVGTGSTEAEAIEAAFAKLRAALARKDVIK
jgi:hypothetical protein